VTVSAETPESIKAGRRKHGLDAIMLADRDLTVTEAFGLRNEGMHSGPPIGPKRLPIPTSLLVGADGKILWMDQSENYQRRSDPDYVLGALKSNLD